MQLKIAFLLRLCRVLACVLAGILVSALACARAAAEDVDHDAYERAISTALERYAEHDWAAARSGFEQAHALDPNARTERGIGLCAYYAHDYPTAARALERALSDTRNALTDEQRAQTQDVLNHVDALVAHLYVDARPTDASIALNGNAIENATPLPVAPGRYHLAVEREGHTSYSKDFELAVGQRLTVDVELTVVDQKPSPSTLMIPVPAAATAASARSPVAIVTEPDRDHRTGSELGRLVPWIAAGATVVLAAAAVGFGLAGNAELAGLRQRCAKDCTEAKRTKLWNDSPINTYAALTNVALLGTAAAAATTVTLFVVMDRHSAADRDQRAPRPAAVGLRVSSEL